MPKIMKDGEELEISQEDWDNLKDKMVGELNSLDDLLGKKFAFQCARYIYYGKVTKITPTHFVLNEAQTIFDTGEYDKKEAEDAQDMPKNILYVMRHAVESIYPTRW